MNISNNSNCVNGLNSKFSSAPKINNIYHSQQGDIVSFSSKSPSIQNTDVWYLKDKQVVEQDVFSTTVIDELHPRSILDKLTGKQYYSKIYDLPLKLREDLKNQKTDTVIQNIPHDILTSTGLTNEELIKEVDKINSLLHLVAPKFELFEEKTKQEFQMKLGNKTATLMRIAQGLSGCIYKIDVPGCKPLALKHYLDPQNINCSEGAFPEIAFARQVNKDGVSNVPLLYSANPYNGWMLSDFVDSNYSKRENGLDFADYVEKNNLFCQDINSGMAIMGKNGPIFVDFGYIYSTNSTTKKYQDVIFSDNEERINSTNYIEDSNVSDLTKIENFAMYGNENTLKIVNKEVCNKPEMLFFFDANSAINNYVLRNLEIPKELQSTLQESYEAMGGIGDVCELLKSCNQ